MKLLSDILYKVPLEEVIGTTHININHLCFDSRQAQPNSLFIAIVGTQTDGHQYIQKAIDKGATAVLCQTFPKQINEKVTYLKVVDTTEALGIVANNFYDYPSTKLALVGITGTNGKTTTATLLFRLFRQFKYNVGLISTIQYHINDQVIPATHTTPDALTLHRLLAEMVEAGCEFCFMEVSSHAVVQNRIAGAIFTGGIFTNMSHDHLDYHGNFKAYIEAKKGFFDQLPNGAFALVNTDDKRGKVMVQNTKANAYAYALKSMAHFKAKILENNLTGLVLDIDQKEVHTLLMGEFNAYNLLAVYGTAYLLGEEKTAILTAISQLTAVEGRFDYVGTPENKITGIVDYSHTPDALLKILTTIHDLRSQDKKIITIVGCGGDRDRSKRPVMAKIACDWSDQVILTSDNPRTEDPDAIIREMEVGIPPQWQQKTVSITNRKEAIKTACLLANNGDIILLAGKGHEKYQEINGVRHPFDDKEELRKAIASYCDS